MLDVRVVNNELQKLKSRLDMMNSISKVKIAEFVSDEILHTQAIKHMQAIIKSAISAGKYILRDKKDIFRDGYLFRDIAKYGILSEEFAAKADGLVVEWDKEKTHQPEKLYDDVAKFLTTFDRYVEYIRSYIRD